MTSKNIFKIVDLFAGPGGLGEGFSSLTDENGKAVFKLAVSIEKERSAYMTLSLRALYRQFPKGKAPDIYYDYLRGEINREQLFNHSSTKHAAEEALQEARKAELGKTPSEEVDQWIKNSLKQDENWVLIGGPPCQAYSLAGRSRRTNESLEKFESDEKHFLYKEYLRIIRKFKPSVFVMENVKGMLSSTHQGSGIFKKIISDLTETNGDTSYEIRSLVVPSESNSLSPKDFIVRAEEFGIPQRRHRVILLGLRNDVSMRIKNAGVNIEELVLSRELEPVTVDDVLLNLPKLRSRLSNRASSQSDSFESWLAYVQKTPKLVKHTSLDVQQLMAAAVKRASERSFTGQHFINTKIPIFGNPSLHSWYHDERLGGVIQHETRSHMPSDLQRYFFAACYAQSFSVSPKVNQFPEALLPAHENATDEEPPFSDRFRVQLSNAPSTTVVSHIAKDGHYYIHPDPSQCRSLTVREAARLQTFPDNYFFEGNRTEQYTQVGNAVPPLLAHKIAQVVSRLMQI